MQLVAIGKSRSAQSRERRGLKTTQSVCPVCLRRLPARVVQIGEQVWLEKTCTDHGAFEALLSSDVRHYYRYDERVNAGGSCCGPGQHCGDQVDNHSCNLLFEITERCNLTCPTCYAGSSPEHGEHLPLARFEELLDQQLARGKGDTDLLQLSGGEPTIHPAFFEIIDATLARGVENIYVNTNGVLLAKPDFADRLARYKEHVSVYLQLDGLQTGSTVQLRGRDLLAKKRRALDNCLTRGIAVVPVAVVTRGVNDETLGELLRACLKEPRLDRLMLQPAMYSGRYENERRRDRVTVADIAREVSRQTDGLFVEDDFGPIPCSEPNCFSAAVAIRIGDRVLPVSRFFPKYESWSDDDVRAVIDHAADSFDAPDKLKALLAWMVQSDLVDAIDDETTDALFELAAQRAAPEGAANGYAGLFTIGVKPFMDAFTYDQDRIDKCCVHIIDKSGEPVSFCEYNALRRPLGMT